MRVVITGHNGQLGRQLQAAFAGYGTLSLELPCDDITHPGVSGCIADFKPDLVLHAAAFTNVDACEADPETAFRVNVLGTQNVATGAGWAGAPMLYVSTNEVFDGSRREPYHEWDPTSPISVYARSKAAGEQIVRDLVPRFYIIRLAWLFGPGGVNFVTKILAGAEKHGALRVASDEFGNPTYAPDLADAIARLIDLRHYGIYHLTNSGYCTRHQWAQEILRLAGRNDVPVTPVSSGEWPRRTAPPPHAILLNTTAAALGIVLRPWQEGLAAYFNHA
jgi:dTDP-4-dehydrorhamnose reductase